MERLRIHFTVFLVIFSALLILQVYGIDVTENHRDKIINENIKENLVQMNQIQEKLRTVLKIKNTAEGTTKNYKTLFLPAMSFAMPTGSRRIQYNASNLAAQLSSLGGNPLRFANESKDSIDRRPVSKVNEATQSKKNFETTKYDRKEVKNLPRFQQKEGNVYTSNKTFLQKYIPCKEGWILYGEKCYQWFRERTRWTNAAENCRKEGGHLVTISSKELQDFLITFLSLNEMWNAWIGLNQINDQSKYTWHDGSDLTFTNWAPGEPSSNLEHCVEMMFNNPNQDPPLWGELGTWNDAYCTLPRPYICQVDRNRDPRFCSINEGGGFKHRESCFNIVKTKMSWEDAEKHCKENFRGHLVTIVDKMLEIFLKYILKDTSEDFWIGIKRHGGEGIQKWSSGFHVVYNRLDGDLKQFPTGTCVLRTKNEVWTIDDCLRELPFICETTKYKDPVLEKPTGWQCPSISKEWIDLEGKFCYIFGKNKQLNWNQANDDCKTKGGNLASITSKDEALILRQYVVTHRYVFIGLRRNAINKRQFEWVDGSRLEYTDWGFGEPNSETEECVQLHSTSNKWYDIKCGLRDHTYICKAKKILPQ